MNIAARLEGIAEPGGIAISDDTYRQVRDKLDVTFDDTGVEDRAAADSPRFGVDHVVDKIHSAEIAPNRRTKFGGPFIFGEAANRDALTPHFVIS